MKEYFVGTVDLSCKPRTFEEAISDPIWHEPMEDEIQSIIKNDTWELKTTSR
jgi:hypothetical protein